MRLLYPLLGTVAVVAMILLTVVAIAYAMGPGGARGAELAGLSNEVAITIAEDGALAVAADTEADLFAGLGYAHALRNAWPMTMLRITAAGERSTWESGPEAITIDRHVKTLGFPSTARDAYRSLPDSSRHLLDRYADGVNAAFAANRLARGDEFLRFGVEPDPWEPWHPLAVEQLVAYLGARVAVDGGGRRVPEIVADFLSADSLLRRSLGISGLEHSVAGSAPDTAGITGFHRIVSGHTATPLVQEVLLSLRGQSVLVASVPGSPALLGGWGADRGWAIVPSSTATLRPTGAAPPLPTYDRVVLQDGREQLVETRLERGAVFIGPTRPLPPDPPAPTPVVPEPPNDAAAVDTVDTEPTQPAPAPPVQQEPTPTPAPPTPTPPPTPPPPAPEPEPEPVPEPPVDDEPLPEEQEDEPPPPPPPPIEPEPLPPIDDDDPPPPQDIGQAQSTRTDGIFRSAALVQDVSEPVGQEAAPDTLAAVATQTVTWWQLSWQGIGTGTDLPAWMALLRGSSQATTLFHGGGVLFDGSGGAAALGSPANVRSLPRGLLVGGGRIADELADRLAQPDSLLPSPDFFGVDTFSAWAARVVPPLVGALQPLDSLSTSLRAPAQYLDSWRYHYDPESIGASVFDRWMAVYQRELGGLPNPAMMNLERFERTDTVSVTFAELVAREVTEAREAGRRVPAIADSLAQQPERADSLVTTTRTRMVDPPDLVAVKTTFETTVSEMVEVYGRPGAQWRWERVQRARLYQPGRAARSSDTERESRNRAFHLGDGGHPTALQWGPSPSVAHGSGPASWTAWRSSANPEVIYVRSPRPTERPRHMRYDDRPDPTPVRAIPLGGIEGRLIRLTPAS